jgi:putative polyhydroxyalkanoate system protein
MSQIHIERSHSLSHEQAREKVDRIAEDLADHYEVDYAWEGDKLGFARSGVNGSIEVQETALIVHVKLGFMAAMFKNAIEHSIEKKLDELLA